MKLIKINSDRIGAHLVAVLWYLIAGSLVPPQLTGPAGSAWEARGRSVYRVASFGSIWGQSGNTLNILDKIDGISRVYFCFCTTTLGLITRPSWRSSWNQHSGALLGLCRSYTQRRVGGFEKYPSEFMIYMSKIICPRTFSPGFCWLYLDFAISSPSTDNNVTTFGEFWRTVPPIAGEFWKKFSVDSSFLRKFLEIT